MTTKLGFIGGGNMASSLIGGLLRNAQINADSIMVFEPNEERAASLAKEFNIQLANNNEQLLNFANVIVIAVKPQVLRSVLLSLKDQFKIQKPLIVSIVAGIRSDSIEQWLDDKYAVVRVMPNTPALVGKGASGLYANERVSEQQKKVTTDLLNSVGVSIWVNSEADIDSVTALSGSGPAYFMLFIQSLIEAGEATGLDRAAAQQLAIATAAGSAQLIADSDQPLSTLIDNVTSPGGTTEQALKSFKDSDLKGIVQTAFNAARIRSEQLAEELGEK